MKLSVIQLDGKAAGDVELSDAVFGISDIRGDILARTVNWQLAKRRAAWTAPQPRYTRGVQAKFAFNASSASKGAVLDNY